MLEFKKGRSDKISSNFLYKEFDCHGKDCCTSTIIDEKLVEYVQKIRDHFKKPVTISSPYRCAVHNKRVGGATKSYHMQGKAADIVVKDTEPKEVAKYAESIGILGIGLYETSQDGYFVHIDTRTSKSFWYGQSEQPRSTFGGTSASTSSSAYHKSQSKYNLSLYYLQYNDKGEDVKALQRILTSYGYNISITGVFDNATKNAVCDFQLKNKLASDGIVGADTMYKLLGK